MSWLKLDVLLCMAAYAVLIGIFLLGRKAAVKKQKKSKIERKPDEVTVIIPFRNEFENLKVLFKCIEELKVKPKEFIFVNDHSEDEFLSLFTDLSFPHRMINVGAESYGKKAAIAIGVNLVETEFVITWDADITVPSNYFEELVKWHWTDLIILPVEMRSSEFVPGFFAMDYQLQTQTNVALTGLFRPITASGANLFFSKKAYLEADEQRSDNSILSGDDQFLLNALRKAGKEIILLTRSELNAETKAPISLQKGMDQRRRWLGKSTKVGDSFAIFFGMIVFLFQMGYYGFAWYQCFIGNWGATIVMILIKGELDAFLTTYKFQEQFNTLKVFLYQVAYPFYMIVLVLSVFWFKVEWKGREDGHSSTNN